ncbi:MAG: tetratricopeptide repeat protein, partial [Planctomycetes bacterium]|nr:tetratricopeptide repeat protein [Planctomycetota bacterium]
LMRRALAIDEKSYGAEHPDVAIRLNNLAQLLQATNRLAEAEPLMRRALAIFRASLGDDHPRTMTVQTSLSAFQESMKNESEPPDP